MPHADIDYYYYYYRCLTTAVANADIESISTRIIKNVQNPYLMGADKKNILYINSIYVKLVTCRKIYHGEKT